MEASRVVKEKGMVGFGEETTGKLFEWRHKHQHARQERSHIPGLNEPSLQASKEVAEGTDLDISLWCL